MNRRSFALAAATCTMLAAVAVLAARDALAQAVDPAKPWKLSTAVGPAFALGKVATRWATLLAASGDGALAVKVYPGATLARSDPARELLALREGAADLAVGSTLYWSAQLVELTMIGLPWLAPDHASVGALIAGALRERLDAAIEHGGAVALAYAALPPRALASTRAVRTPADLSGLRVRITATPYLADLFTAMGAQPQASSFTDAQQAFRAGTLDAQEGTLPMFAAAKLDALGLRHVTLWGAIAEVAVFAASRAAWERATEAQRARLRDSANEAARELAALAQSDHDAALAQLQRGGVTVTRPTATGQRAFAGAARGVYDKWAAAAGSELVNEAEAAVKEAEKR